MHMLITTFISPGASAFSAATRGLFGASQMQTAAAFHRLALLGPAGSIQVKKVGF